MVGIHWSVIKMLHEFRYGHVCCDAEESGKLDAGIQGRGGTDYYMESEQIELARIFKRK